MADNGNKRYYWLKLSEDFFRQKEIKKLRRIAGGDTYKNSDKYSSYVYFGLYATDGETILYLHNGVWSESPTPIRYSDYDPNSNATDMFTLKFENTNYIYRVGNINTVSLGSLFGVVEGKDIVD